MVDSLGGAKSRVKQQSIRKRKHTGATARWLLPRWACPDRLCGVGPAIPVSIGVGSGPRIGIQKGPL